MKIAQRKLGNSSKEDDDSDYDGDAGRDEQPEPQEPQGPPADEEKWEWIGGCDGYYVPDQDCDPEGEEPYYPEEDDDDDE